MDLSPVSEDPRPDGWPGNQQPGHEGDEATGFEACNILVTISGLDCKKDWFSTQCPRYGTLKNPTEHLAGRRVKCAFPTRFKNLSLMTNTLAKWECVLTHRPYNYRDCHSHTTASSLFY